MRVIEPVRGTLSHLQRNSGRSMCEFSKPVLTAVAFNAPGIGIAWDLALGNGLAAVRSTVQ
jgi:hypothetical protein